MSILRPNARALLIALATLLFGLAPALAEEPMILPTDPAPLVARTADGDKSFSMFTRGKSAWMENAAEEPALIAAMRNGTDMLVLGTSGRGNPTKYTFSLKGISAALQSIQNCK